MWKILTLLCAKNLETTLRINNFIQELAAAALISAGTINRKNTNSPTAIPFNRI
jgi:hypothetical protein